MDYALFTGRCGNAQVVQVGFRLNDWPSLLCAVSIVSVDCA